MAKLIFTLFALVCCIILTQASQDGARYSTTGMEQIAESLARAGDHDSSYWLNVMQDSINKCTRAFADEMDSQFEAIDSSDHYRFFEFIQRGTADYCSKTFQPEIRSMARVVNSIKLLDVLVDGYEAGDGYFSLDDEDAALQVALVMKELHKNQEPARKFQVFRRQYFETSPCAVLNRKCQDRPGLRSYIEFLRMAASPGYYKYTDLSHLEFVDIVAACDNIENTDGIMAMAYKRYKQMTGQRG